MRPILILWVEPFWIPWSFQTAFGAPPIEVIVQSWPTFRVPQQLHKAALLIFRSPLVCLYRGNAQLDRANGAEIASRTKSTYLEGARPSNLSQPTTSYSCASAGWMSTSGIGGTIFVDEDQHPR